MFGLSPWMLWAIVGIVLIIIELLSLTFVLAFFGIGALVAAVVAVFVSNFTIQVGVFLLVSFLLLIFLRRSAKTLFFGHKDMPPDYLGQRVKVVVDIPPGGEGRIEYRGSPWIAYSDDPATITAGSTVEMIDATGIKLKVKRV